MRLDDLLRLFPDGQKQGAGYVARCPAHDDHAASLSFSEGEKGLVLHCFVGCSLGAICAALSIAPASLFYETKGGASTLAAGASTRTFEIRTTAGALVALRKRTDFPDKPKELWWEQPDGKRGLGGIKTSDLPLFNSQRIADFPLSRWVELCEGEGKTEELRALGACALGTSTGAASAPSVGVLESLRHRRVRLWPDNDNGGRAHMATIAERLRGIASLVVTLDTSGLPKKGDAVEWIEAEVRAGMDRGRLRVLLSNEDRAELPGLPLYVPGAEPAKPKPPPVERIKEEFKKSDTTAAPSLLPLINTSGQQLRESVAHAWEAIHKASAEQPIMFRRAGQLVSVDQEGEASPKVLEISEAAMRFYLSNVANWFRLKGTGENEKIEAISPPLDVVQSLIAVHDKKIPALDLVSNSPLFSPSGEVCTQQGYNAAGRVWLTKAAEVGLQLIEPTKENALKAVAFLLDDLLVDFKFAQPCDRANCLAALLLPAVRSMISGPTPLHDVNSPVQRVGKSLLVSVLTTVYLGSPVVAQNLPNDEKEVAKTLLAELLLSRPFIFFDNGDNKDRRLVDSASLEMALTANEYASRILGQSKMSADIAVRAVWFITGVNLEFKKGLMGRRVRIRLDPRLENPSARTGFIHPNIVSYAKQNRAIILSAIFTIVRYFLSIPPAERPKARTLGSYEEWAQLLGGILLSVDVPGFLEHLDDPAEQAVEGDADEWEEFIVAWIKEFDDYPQPIAKLNDLAAAKGHLEAIRGDKTKASQVIRLGQALKKSRDHIIGNRRLTYSANKHTKNAEYSLEKLTKEAAEPVELPSVDLPF